MPWIDRPAAFVDGAVEFGTMFDALLAPVVAADAQRLQFAQHERVDVAAMRLDVIDDARRGYQALLQTHHAQRLDQ
jgi:hypothetical protein